MRCILVFCRKCPQWTILYRVKLKLFTTEIAIENIQVNKTAVFSKQIRYILTSTEQVSTMSQTSVVTRSQYEPIQWDFCFIYQNKTFKKDFKVHKIPSGECVNQLMECALSQNDDRLVRVLHFDDFVLKGVYHNGCMTKYMLKSSPKNEQIQDSDLSSNEIAFQI